MKFKVNRCKYSEDENRCAPKCSKLQRKDFIYVTIILVIVIIVLSTMHLAGNKLAIEYFSFAGTISSIILSIIAIFMSINSESKNALITSSMEKSIDELHKLEESITASESKINEYISSLDDKFRALDEKIEKQYKNIFDAIPQANRNEDLKNIDNWSNMEDVK